MLCEITFGQLSTREVFIVLKSPQKQKVLGKISITRRLTLKK